MVTCKETRRSMPGRIGEVNTARIDSLHKCDVIVNKSLWNLSRACNYTSVHHRNNWHKDLKRLKLQNWWKLIFLSFSKHLATTVVVVLYCDDCSNLCNITQSRENTHKDVQKAHEYGKRICWAWVLLPLTVNVWVRLLKFDLKLLFYVSPFFLSTFESVSLAIKFNKLVHFIHKKCTEGFSVLAVKLSSSICEIVIKSNWWWKHLNIFAS